MKFFLPVGGSALVGGNGVKSRIHQDAFTLVELLVVIGIIGVLIGIAIPAVQAVRGAANKTRCANNLHQVALAVANYESTFHRLPMGCHRIDDPTWPSRTWLAEILPYVEENAMYEESVAQFQVGLSPFSHVTHQRAVVVYGCPADGRSGAAQWTHGPLLVALTSYVGVAGINRTQPNGVLVFDESIRLSDVTDGLSNTLMIGERPASPDNWYGWWYAGLGQDKTGNPEMIMGVRETNLQVQYAESCPVGPYHFKKGHFDEMCDVFHFWSPHSGGANFAFCDGSIKLLPYSADTVFPDLATRAGHEVVGAY